MMRAFLSLTALLLTLIAVGCTSRKDVCNDEFSGTYQAEDDGSTLVISMAENGYDVSIKLFRLTEIDDGFGHLKDGELIFTGTDGAGNPISGAITVSGDTAKLVFRDSTWEYLPKGSTFTFESVPALAPRS